MARRPERKAHLASKSPEPLVYTGKLLATRSAEREVPREEAIVNPGYLFERLWLECGIYGLRLRFCDLGQDAEWLIPLMTTQLSTDESRTWREVNTPQEEVIAPSPEMPPLLHFGERVKDGVLEVIGFVVVFETLDEHSGIDPRERSPKLRSVVS